MAVESSSQDIIAFMRDTSFNHRFVFIGNMNPDRELYFSVKFPVNCNWFRDIETNAKYPVKFGWLIQNLKPFNFVLGVLED